MSGALGIIASGHKFAAAALTLAFNARTYQEDTSGGQNENLNANNTMTTSLSAGDVGDIAVLWERRINSASTVVPATNLNSGWTSIGSFSIDASREFREDFSYKIMTSSDISSGTVTTGPAEILTNTILFFTPSQTIQSTNVHQFIDKHAVGTVSSESQTPGTGTGTASGAPVIIFYTKTTQNARTQGSNVDVDCAIGGTAGTAIGSNSFFETIPGGGLHIRTDDHRIGFIIQNSTLSSVQNSPTDEGGRQSATCFHLSFS